MLTARLVRALARFFDSKKHEMSLDDYHAQVVGSRCVPEDKICPSRGIDIDQAAAEIARQIPAKKYPALRVIARLFQIIRAL